MAKNSQQELNWNEKEFLTFLLLYAANIDMDYSAEEKTVIQKLLDKSHYVKVRDTFRSLNDMQCIELIQSYKGVYYPTGDRTELLLSKLDELFDADGDYSHIESACRSMLNRLL